MFEKFSNAEDVVRVAHCYATMQAVGSHDDSDTIGGFRRVAALSLCDDTALRDTMVHEVIPPDAALAECWVQSRSASRDDDWC